MRAQIVAWVGRQVVPYEPDVCAWLRHALLIDVALHWR